MSVGKVPALVEQTLWSGDRKQASKTQVCQVTGVMEKSKVGTGVPGWEGARFGVVRRVCPGR